MAFKSIDDAAWPLTDDGPLASVASVRARDNAEACNTERNPQCAVVFPPGEPLRLCSVFPGASGPYWLWLPKNQRWSTATVRVRVGTVELEGGTDGDPAAYIKATMGTPGFRGRAYMQPPGLDDTWEELARGDDGTTTMTVDLEGASGWVAFFVWILSEMGEDAEDTTTLWGADEFTSSWLVEEMTTPPTATPPEKAAVVHPDLDPSGTPREISEHTYQLCYFDAVDSATDRMYVLPPPQRYNVALRSQINSNDVVQYTGADVALYALGVVPVQAISIEATPRRLEPVASAFFSGAHVAEQWQHLATATNRMIDTRTRQWCMTPGPDSYSDGNHARPWPLRADNALGYTGAAPLDEDYQRLMSTTVVDAPPDDNGYTAILSFFLMSSDLDDITFRLSAYNGCVASDTLQDSGEAITLEPEALAPFNKPPIHAASGAAMSSVDPYTPTGHSVLGSSWFMDWQTRGLLMWENIRNGDGLHDWQRCYSLVLPPLSSGSLTYPIRLVVEAKISDEDHAAATIFCVVGGAIRSRDVG